MKDYKNSVFHGIRGLEVLKESQSNPEYISNTLHTLGVSYFFTKQYDISEAYFLEACELSLKSGYKEGLIDCNKGLYDIQKEKRNFEKALHFYQEYIRYRDSVFNIQTFQKINKIESEKLVSKKNQEIANLSIDRVNSENELKKSYNKYGIVLLVCIVTLFLGIVFYALRNRAIIAENKEKILQSKLHALRSQMNPHFIFNTLNSVQNFILKSEKFEAYNYLNRFSELIRLILNNSKHSFTELNKEILLIRMYVDLEQLRFRNKIKYIEDINFDVDNDNTQVSAMILQPIIENAIIHGLMGRKEGGFIKLTIRKQNNMVKCIIEDNGIGRENSVIKTQEKVNKHLSMSGMNTKLRIEMLQKNGHPDSFFNIEDLYDSAKKPSGTKVTVLLPIMTSQ
ncbi:histidine kinase [uncultured Aquimarina sp.]|uniref:sensor histidine kinase n=1 Tax=uncultured Aquimarina sp. TaxID=575652 RepID=UPI00262BB04B|nr:histidine kinase [uncultured Aquimarina sp.]